MRPRCAPHGLAIGPDGRCALCRRAEVFPEGRASHRRRRRAAKIAVAIFAGFAVFAWLLVAFDTKPPERRPAAQAR